MFNPGQTVTANGRHAVVAYATPRDVYVHTLSGIQRYAVAQVRSVELGVECEPIFADAGVGSLARGVVRVRPTYGPPRASRAPVPLRLVA